MGVSCGEGMGASESRVGEGMLKSPLPNTSTDQQGLGHGGHPGGRGCLPPCLPAGGPGCRAGRVHIRSRLGDPGRLPGLPRPTLAAPAAPTVNQRPAAQHVFRRNGESGASGGDSVQQWDLAGYPLPLPGCCNVRLNTRHSCSQTCVSLCVREGGWGA